MVESGLKFLEILGTRDDAEEYTNNVNEYYVSQY
jgi:hypothetical protein